MCNLQSGLGCMPAESHSCKRWVSWVTTAGGRTEPTGLNPRWAQSGVAGPGHYAFQILSKGATGAQENEEGWQAIRDIGERG
jgi:hypothetical protein